MGALKKPNIIPLTDKKQATNEQLSNVVMKTEIDRMKKLLSEKIKDPKLAAKAAMIITEMLDPKTK